MVEGKNQFLTMAMIDDFFRLDGPNNWFSYRCEHQQIQKRKFDNKEARNNGAWNRTSIWRYTNKFS